MTHDPGKEPQTIESLQAENGELRRLLNVERRKVRDLWKRIAQLEREKAHE